MKKIILIDDEPEILSLLEYLFNQLNFEVFSFFNIIPLSSMAEISPDVIILDYNLGTALGSDFCKEIKAYPETSHLPVIMLSANEWISEIAQDSCADDYLTKPFDIDKLHRTVKKVMLSAAS